MPRKKYSYPGTETSRYPKLTSETALSLVQSNPDFNKAVWSKYIADKLFEVAHTSKLTANIHHRPMEKKPLFHILNEPSEYHYITYSNEALLNTSKRSYKDPLTLKKTQFITFMFPAFRVSPDGEVSVGWFSGDYKDDFTSLEVSVESTFIPDPFLDFTFNRNLSLPIPPTPLFTLASKDFI